MSYLNHTISTERIQNGRSFLLPSIFCLGGWPCMLMKKIIHVLHSLCILLPLIYLMKGPKRFVLLEPYDEIFIYTAA